MAVKVKSDADMEFLLRSMKPCRLRKAFKYDSSKTFEISVVGSMWAYSSPKKYLETIEEYSSLEVAMYWNGGSIDGKQQWITKPSILSSVLKRFDKFWTTNDDVAGYVPTKEVLSLVSNLGKLFEEETIEELRGDFGEEKGISILPKKLSRKIDID